MKSMNESLSLEGLMPSFLMFCKYTKVCKSSDISQRLSYDASISANKDAAPNVKTSN